MSFRRRESSLHQINFDESSAGDYFSGTDFSTQSPEQLIDLFYHMSKTGMHKPLLSLYEDVQQPSDSITEEQVRRRMKIIAPNTKWTRSFSHPEGNEFIPVIAKEYGIETQVISWLGDDP